MENGEGKLKSIPAIAVGWDAENQSVAVRFNNSEFKTWDFLIATLQMAVSWAEQQRRLAQFGAVQQQSAEDQQLKNVLKSLRH